MMAKTKFAMAATAILTLSGCAPVNRFLEAFPTYPYGVAFLATLTWGLTWIGLLMISVYLVNQWKGLNKESFNRTWALLVFVSGLLSYGFSYKLPWWALIVTLALAMVLGYWSIYRFQIGDTLPQFALRKLGWETALPAPPKIKGFDLDNLLSKVKIPFLRPKPAPSVQTPRCVCGLQLLPGARFCGCGRPVGQPSPGPIPPAPALNQPPRCVCGLQLLPGARFCGCGRPVGHDIESPDSEPAHPKGKRWKNL